MPGAVENSGTFRIKNGHKEPYVWLFYSPSLLYSPLVLRDTLKYRSRLGSPECQINRVITSEAEGRASSTENKGKS